MKRTSIRLLRSKSRSLTYTQSIVGYYNSRKLRPVLGSNRCRFINQYKGTKHTPVLRYLLRQLFHWVLLTVFSKLVIRRWPYDKLLEVTYMYKGHIL